jgi:hypothetical protein
MDDFLFFLQMAFVLAGIALMCAALLQMKRQGGFRSAIALTPDGKWPVGRLLSGAALLCFALALVVALLTFFD